MNIFKVSLGLTGGLTELHLFEISANECMRIQSPFSCFAANLFFFVMSVITI